MHSYKANQPYCTRRWLQAIIAAGLSALCVYAQSPTELLAQADRLGDRSDWRSAGPLYAKAEAAYRSSGDVRNELYARIGRLHRDLADGSYRTVRAEVVKVLANPVAQNDIPLRIHVLALLGNIDLNIDTAAALVDWNQILALAKKSGDQKWENRAQGELGLVAGVNGDMGTAAFALYSAIGKADQIGDVAAHLNFATWLGNGMAIHGMADRSVKIIDQAAELARKSGYSSVPLQLSIAKIRALANLPEPQIDQSRAMAKDLIATTLIQAQNEHVLGAQTELLNEAGQLAAKQGDLAGAEKA